MNEILSISQWLTMFINSSEKLLSVHLDGELIDQDLRPYSGVDLINNGEKILIETFGYLKRGNTKHDIDNISICYPLGFSRRILFFDEKLWKNVSVLNEPPSIYFSKTQQMFDEYLEEYRRPIKLPFESGLDIKALFRSWRDVHYMEKGWEFSSEIWLIAKTGK